MTREYGPFCYSLDGEMYSGGYATIEEAIEEGMELAWDNEQKEFHVGRSVAFLPRLSAWRAIDEVGEAAYNAVGYAADGWPNPTPEEEEDLARRLTDVFRQWMKETDNEPTFFEVTDTRVVAVPEDYNADG